MTNVSRQDRSTRVVFLEHAIAYAQLGWAVFPLRGKAPAIAGGHGVLDATCDVSRVARWWQEMRWANIGGRVPDGLLLLDLDPRHGALEDPRVGQLPVTLMAWSGRGDGGRHLYFQRPGGRLWAKGLPRGWEFKTSSGYGLLPPSLHPATGKPYRWDDVRVPPAPLPDWLVALLRPPAPRPTPPRAAYAGDSIAEWFTDTHTWHDVLAPAGWLVVAGDGDSDGSRWVHPTATSNVSATVRNGCLFVFSTRTPFEPTTAGAPCGYTRFRAFAVLSHDGDLTTAARAAARLRGAGR
jgi:hypothetical protein